MFNPDDLTSIGKLLRKVRKEKDLTMKELAELTNSSQGYISDIENRFTIPSIPKLIEICSVLGISLKELFDDKTDIINCPEFYHQIKDLSSNQLELLNEFLLFTQTLSNEQIDLLIKLLKTVK